MRLTMTLLGTSLLFALAACKPAAEPVAADPAAPAATGHSDHAAASAVTAAAGQAPAATSGGDTCSFTLEGKDAMAFNVKNIDVPRQCTQFTIALKHVGTMPVETMGHNVVIAKSSDIMAIAADGASVRPGHVKPGDTRVLAHSDMIGGGASTQVSFEVAKISEGGYAFFCSFPGHAAMMQGTLTLI